MRNWISSLYTWNQYIVSQLHSNIKLSFFKKKKAYIWNDKCKNSQNMSESKNSFKETSKF